jgi:hypothetical protein
VPPSLRRSSGMSAAVAFASSSERSSSSWNPSRPLPKQRPWAPPLMALPAFAPTPIDRSRVHSQRLRRAAFGSSVPPDDSRSAPVVSHHLGGFLRAAATGLLHPAAGPEVHRVSWCVRPKLPKVLRPVGPFPAMRFIPFEGFPSSEAVPHHCGPFPLAVGRRPPRPSPGSGETPGPASTLTPKCAGARSAAPTEAGVAACHLRRDDSGIRTEPRPKPPLELTLLQAGGLPSTRSDRGRGEHLTATPKCAGGTKARASAR